MWSKTVFATGKAAATCVQENPGISVFRFNHRIRLVAFLFGISIGGFNGHPGKKLEKTYNGPKRRPTDKKSSNGRKVIQRTEDTYTSNGPKIRTRPTDRRSQTDIHFQRTVRPPTDANVERTEEPQRTFLFNDLVKSRTILENQT